MRRFWRRGRPPAPTPPRPPGWSFQKYRSGDPGHGPTASWDDSWDSVRLYHRSGFYIILDRFWDIERGGWNIVNWQQEAEKQRLAYLNLTKEKPGYQIEDT